MDERNEQKDRHDWLAERFEAERTHLKAVAYRMLGSQTEAEDAVQESWLRLSHADTSDVQNLGGWLTTVVARVCLDMLRSRARRHEEPLGEETPEPAVSREDAADPEQEALLADSVGLALLVVLDTLNPAERLAFVLHDLFDVPFEEIAPIVGRTPTAARQLASRARRQVQGKGREQEQETAPDADLRRQRTAANREIVAAFLAASRNGDFDALLVALDPDVTLHADAAIVAMGAAVGMTSETQGAEAVAQQFVGRAHAARLALIDGSVGAVWGQGGQPRAVFSFTITDGKIAAIEIIADPERLSQLDVAILDE
ncbi:MAG TPA: sigma-70 family RNA polymerase sigma factor [Ktedonobacterales bacterium]|jgi:RNA polymerase sigma-70 factor (ECF subfamily)